MNLDGAERLVSRLREYCGDSLRAVIETDESGNLSFHYVRKDYYAAHDRDSERVEDSMRRWATPPNTDPAGRKASVSVYWDATTVHLPRGNRTFSVVLEPDASGRLNDFVDWCRIQLT